MHCKRFLVLHCSTAVPAQLQRYGNLKASFSESADTSAGGPYVMAAGILTEPSFVSSSNSPPCFRE